MRRYRLGMSVIAFAVSLFALGALADARGGSYRAPARADDAVSCMGLQCASAGQDDYVPEAMGQVSMIRNGDTLQDLPQGFYSYRGGNPDPNATGNEITVSYVITPGGFAAAPRSVKSLEIIENSRISWETDTVVVLGSFALSVNPGADESEGRPAKRRSPYDCGFANTCFFNNEGFPQAGPRLELGSNSVSQGWMNLKNFAGAYDNNLESQVNNRAIARLARDTNGNGIDYCAATTSEDSSFANNPIDNNRASSVKITNNYGAC